MKSRMATGTRGREELEGASRKGHQLRPGGGEAGTTQIKRDARDWSEVKAREGWAEMPVVTISCSRDMSFDVKR